MVNEDEFWYLCCIADRKLTAVCHHCDGCGHETLEDCPAWAEDRVALCAVVGLPPQQSAAKGLLLSLPIVVHRMVDSGTSWTAVQALAECVILRKEAAERERKDTTDLADRRWRPEHKPTACTCSLFR
ncbi:uncharacterized protein LOC128678912 [Plodia interpunctella]|uniref:uncharacterized protein LOC128678912 n=1 Tax=Plodia interpunctella TaxID=58824 RepID=UPI002367C30B|nr:uncharacterized protein LOC128678912 [Plodia interpunctella]